MYTENEGTACRCAAYLRVSQEDGDKRESDSIHNQRAYINSYAESHGLFIKETFIDDGCSGVSFDRPGFLKLLEAIKDGRINCVIVKDLSRFGRNYIEAGRYIEQIFPYLDVRFIAINDNYDSHSPLSPADSMFLPFKNLLNDAYSRDISIKTITSLDVKRKRGDYLGAFAPYGYKKSAADKNRLEIDEEAAEIIRRIYRLRIAGKSDRAIAQWLNREEIPSPLAYKLAHGERVSCHFQTSPRLLWHTYTVRRILRDEQYLGHLIQGKSRRISYKIRRQIPVPKEQWIRCEHTHEAIVSPESARLVKRLEGSGIQQPAGRDFALLFSGLAVCGLCGRHLSRKTVGKYHYWGCYNRDRSARCRGAAINETALSQLTLQIIRKHAAVLLQLSGMEEELKAASPRERSLKTLDSQVDACKQKLETYQRLSSSLREDFREGILDREEYLSLRQTYETRVQGLRKRLDVLNARRQNALDSSPAPPWQDGFPNQEKAGEILPALDRPLLLTLTDSIKVFPKKQVEIVFRCRDEWNGHPDPAPKQADRKEADGHAVFPNKITPALQLPIPSAHSPLPPSLGGGVRERRKAEKPGEPPEKLLKDKAGADPF